MFQHFDWLPDEFGAGKGFLSRELPCYSEGYEKVGIRGEAMEIAEYAR